MINPAKYIRENYGEKKALTYLRYYKIGIPERFWEVCDVDRDKVERTVKLIKNDVLLGITSNDDDKTSMLLSECAKVVSANNSTLILNFDEFVDSVFDRYNNVLNIEKNKKLYSVKYLFLIDVTHSLVDNADKIRNSFYRSIKFLINKSFTTKVIMGFDGIDETNFKRIYGDLNYKLFKIDSNENKRFFSINFSENVDFPKKPK